MRSISQPSAGPWRQVSFHIVAPVGEAPERNQLETARRERCRSVDLQIAGDDGEPVHLADPVAGQGQVHAGLARDARDLRPPEVGKMQAGLGKVERGFHAASRIVDDGVHDRGVPWAP